MVYFLEVTRPVAQRLEQGTHNSLQALGSLLHARNSIGSQRLQTTARHAENGNKWQQSRVGRSNGSRQAHAPEHDKEKAFFQPPWRGMPGPPRERQASPCAGAPVLEITP